MNLFPSASPRLPAGSPRAAVFPSPPLVLRRAPRCACRLALGGRLGLLGALLLCDAAQAVAPDALPVDGRIREGGVAITRDAHVMQIQQAGERAIVDWQSFDVGRNASVRIAQPSSGAMLLNRVRGETRSTIAGQLEANGQVCLVNPNGIRISSRGTVSAAGFVASTLDIADRDFMNGNLHFGSVAQPGTGSVIHDGSIIIEPSGFTALLGHRIEQTGVTRTQLGQTGLGVGQAIKLLPGQDPFLEITLMDRHLPADSDDLTDRPTPIVMTGTIEADGGLVQIAAPMATAQSRRPLEAIHLSGVVLAQNAFTRTGTIQVNGDGGIVRLAGRLDASSNEMHRMLHRGGTVEISGRRVIMEDQGIDVSGALGGGRVQIAARHADGGTDAGSATGGSGADGGDDPMVFIGAWARINASATYRGEAGDVRLASDGRVVFLGQGQALGAAFAPGPSQLALVANTVVPDTDHQGAAGTARGASVTPPMPPSASPPAASGATSGAPQLLPTWHVSRYEPGLPSFDRQPSRHLSAPAASGWRLPPPVSVPAASGWQPSSPASVSAASGWQPTPDVAELPSLRWTPPLPVAPADVVAGTGGQG